MSKQTRMPVTPVTDKAPTLMDAVVRDLNAQIAALTTRADAADHHAAECRQLVADLERRVREMEDFNRNQR